MVEIVEVIPERARDRSAGLDWATKIATGAPLHLATVALYTLRGEPPPAPRFRIVASRAL